MSTYVYERLHILIDGYILFSASKTISSGSEMLLGVFGPGIVGGLVIPILGAVPDGMIILLSGMGDGPKEEIQETLAVGVGTLAGSTIMLLTIPWAVGVYLNQRQLDHKSGKAKKVLVTNADGKAVFKPAAPTGFSLFENCATALQDTPKGARIMMATSLTYILVQVPAALWGGNSDIESKFAILGMIISVVSFFTYLVYQLNDSDASEQLLLRKTTYKSFNQWVKSQELSQRYAHLGNTFEKVFEALDKDNDGYLDEREVRKGLLCLGFEADATEARRYLRMMDADSDGRVSLGEWGHFVENFIAGHVRENIAKTSVEPGATYKKAADPGQPPAATLKRLEDWYASSEEALDLTLDPQGRHQVHVWANSKTAPRIAHYSKDKDGGSKKDKYDTNATRVLHLEKYTGAPSLARRGSMSIQIHSWTDVSAPRWANASDSLLQYSASLKHDFDAVFSRAARLPEGASQEELRDFAKSQSLPVSDQALQVYFFQSNDEKTNLLPKEQFRRFLEQFVSDTPSDAKASYKTFQGDETKQPLIKKGSLAYGLTINSTGGIEGGEEGGEDDDAEEEEDEHAGWSQRQKMFFAFLLLAAGTAVVTIFSDPMVEVIGAFAKKVNISPFYVSFIVTPIASNASEVISGLIFASRKTNKGLALTFSSLYGAATMNNTFCLAIFLGLVYFRGLAWNFTAEVTSILVVVWVVGIIGQRQTVLMWQAVVVGLMFPGALAIVWVLENLFGLS